MQAFNLPKPSKCACGLRVACQKCFVFILWLWVLSRLTEMQSSLLFLFVSCFPAGLLWQIITIHSFFTLPSQPDSFSVFDWCLLEDQIIGVKYEMKSTRSLLNRTVHASKPGQQYCPTREVMLISNVENTKKHFFYSLPSFCMDFSQRFCVDLKKYQI